MSSPKKSHEHAELFRSELLEKIQKLLDEFAMGQISREQFNLLYERYNNRLTLVEGALHRGDSDALTRAQDGPPTIALRAQTEGRAQGILVLHRRDNSVLETLGSFEVPHSQLQLLLNSWYNMDEPRLEEITDGQWLLLVARQYSIVATEFRNEPARQQIRMIERLLQDFEQANHQHLQEPRVDPQRLAYPFLVFIQKKLKR